MKPLSRKFITLSTTVEERIHIQDLSKKYGFNSVANFIKELISEYDKSNSNEYLNRELEIIEKHFDNLLTNLNQKVLLDLYCEDSVSIIFDKIKNLREDIHLFIKSK